MTIKISQMTDAGALTGAELLELSKLSATVTKTASTISALASDNSFNDSGAGWVAAGFAVGDQVKVTGFTGNVANNIFSAKVTVLTAGKMTIGGADGDAIVDDAAGESVTITKWETCRTTADEIATLAAGGGNIPDQRYTIDTGSTADSDPGAGLLKFNHATPSSATFLYIDDSTSDSVDLSTYFTGLGATGFIKIQSVEDAEEWMIFKWTAVTDGTGYWKFAVVHQASKGTLDDADAVMVSFDSRAADTSINPQTASYSAVLADANNVVTMDVASANDFTVPTNASQPIPIGSFLEVWQKGAGQTTIVAAGGVTILYDDHLTLNLLGQDAGCTLRKVATNIWRLIGLMEPAAALEADAIEFDNTASGFSATEVQEAIDEIAAILTAGAGYAEGTSNPGSPSTGDIFYRTDLKLLITYDGTRWLTVEQFKADFTVANISATAASGYVHVRQDFAIYMEKFLGSALANGTNNGTNYWDITLQWMNAANTGTTLATLTTSAGAGTTWLPLTSTINAALSGSALALRINATKALSAGNLFAGFMLTYRLIIT